MEVLKDALSTVPTPTVVGIDRLQSMPALTANRLNKNTNGKIKNAFFMMITSLVFLGLLYPISEGKQICSDVELVCRFYLHGLCSEQQAQVGKQKCHCQVDVVVEAPHLKVK